MEWIPGAGLSRVLTTVGVVLAVLQVVDATEQTMVLRALVRAELETPGPGGP